MGTCCIRAKSFNPFKTIDFESIHIEKELKLLKNTSHFIEKYSNTSKVFRKSDKCSIIQIKCLITGTLRVAKIYRYSITSSLSNERQAKRGILELKSLFFVRKKPLTTVKSSKSFTINRIFSYR